MDWTRHSADHVCPLAATLNRPLLGAARFVCLLLWLERLLLRMPAACGAGERSPLATTLAYLDVSRPGSEDSAWLELLVRRVFERLLHNVAQTRTAAAAVGAGGRATPGGVRSGAVSVWGEAELCCACACVPLWAEVKSGWLWGVPVLDGLR